MDNWSLGVILYICLVGYPPFTDEGTTVPLEQQICKGLYTFPTEYWSNVSNDAIDMVKNLLNVDVNKRYSLDQVLNHKWIKNDKEVKKLAEKIMAGNGSSTNKSKIDSGNKSIKNGNPNKLKLKRVTNESEIYGDSDDDSTHRNGTCKRLKTSNSDSTEKSNDS